MGQTLSFPVIEKRSRGGANDRFAYAVSELQGWRISMEDAHSTVLDLDNENKDSNAFFAVYDGHGGGTVAKYAGENLHKRLRNEETYQQKEYGAALKKAFLGTDEDLLADPQHTRDTSGCTAVAALLTDDGKIYVANAGDSRSVIGIKGEVKPLSFDHKPTNDVEKQRIHKAGGYIEYGRVNGNLALSRALGDFEFKKNYSLTPEEQIITADPDITCHDISEEDEFLVLACDGIWDCMSSQEVVDSIRFLLSQGNSLQEICERICDHCLAPDASYGAGIGCDNMTIMVVAILHGRTQEEWQAWVTDRVSKGYGYQTPSKLPSLYEASRVKAFQARKATFERSHQKDEQRNNHDTDGPLGEHGNFVEMSPFASRLLSLIGKHDDNDEEDSGEEETTTRSLFAQALLDHGDAPDSTEQLKAHIDEFEKDMQGDVNIEKGDVEMGDASSATSSDKSTNINDSHPQREAPQLSNLLPNGTAPSNAVEQLKHEAHGDNPLPVVKAEGFIDSSEDPLVQA